MKKGRIQSYMLGQYEAIYCKSGEGFDYVYQHYVRGLEASKAGKFLESTFDDRRTDFMFYQLINGIFPALTTMLFYLGDGIDSNKT